MWNVGLDFAPWVLFNVDPGYHVVSIFGWPASNGWYDIPIIVGA